MFGNKRAQSALEYALLIVVIIIALLAINVYMKRAVQGRLRESADEVGRQFNPEDYNLSWRTQSSGQSITTETRNAAGTTSNTTQGETVSRSEHDEFGGSIPTSYY